MLLFKSGGSSTRRR